MKRSSFQIHSDATFSDGSSKIGALRTKLFGHAKYRAPARIVPLKTLHAAVADTRSTDDVGGDWHRPRPSLAVPLPPPMPAIAPRSTLLAKASIIEAAVKQIPDRFSNVQVLSKSAGQREYKGHMISPVQLRDGSWIANFTRIGGTPANANGLPPVAPPSNSYLSCFLAIADAEIEIDELEAPGLSPAV